MFCFKPGNFLPCQCSCYPRIRQRPDALYFARVVSRWNAVGRVGFLVAGCRCQLLADVKQLQPVNLPLAEVSYGSSVYGDPLTPHFWTLSAPITSAVYKHCVRPTNCSLEDGTQHILVPLSQLHTQMVRKTVYSYIMQTESTYKLIVTKVVAHNWTYPRSFAKELKKHNRQHEKESLLLFLDSSRQKRTIILLEFRPSRRWKMTAYCNLLSYCTSLTPQYSTWNSEWKWLRYCQNIFIQGLKISGNVSER
jgi:hypothetical protein